MSFEEERDTQSDRVRREVVEYARKILDRAIDPAIGARELVAYRYTPELLAALLPVQEEILFFVGLDSQMDEYPVSANERYLWNPEVLAKLDKERTDFIDHCQDGIDATCHSIIAKISNKNFDK